MAQIPASVFEEPLKGLERIHQGKVRDTYALPRHPKQLLVVATDRISIFDFVLPVRVPQKGEILHAMNVFWRVEVMGNLFPQDYWTAAGNIDEFLSNEARGNIELRKRALIVHKLSMLPLEAIIRGYLTGSGLKAYRKTTPPGVNGHRLPHGLHDGSRLPFPIFTPTTKAEEGHDEPMDIRHATQLFGSVPERFSLQAYLHAQAYAEKRGIIIADTKFEFGRGADAALDDVQFADEILTPDSSRFWDAKDWERSAADKKSPHSLDKQLVREWGKAMGVDERDPSNPDDVAYVHGLEIPQDIVDRTRKIYRYIFWRLIGEKLECFQRRQMGIDTRPEKVRVDVLLGSYSDFAQTGAAVSYFERAIREGLVAPAFHVVSCHRNPDELRQYAESCRAEVVIAAAGKAAALPGILSAWLRHYGKPHIPVIGVALDGATDEARRASRLSIEELPGQPVILDSDGRAFFGPEGFKAACELAVMGEFLPAKEGFGKNAEFNVPMLERGLATLPLGRNIG